MEPLTQLLQSLLPVLRSLQSYLENLGLNLNSTSTGTTTTAAPSLLPRITLPRVTG